MHLVQRCVEVEVVLDAALPEGVVAPRPQFVLHICALLNHVQIRDPRRNLLYFYFLAEVDFLQFDFVGAGDAEFAAVDAQGTVPAGVNVVEAVVLGEQKERVVLLPVRGFNSLDCLAVLQAGDVDLFEVDHAAVEVPEPQLALLVEAAGVDGLLDVSDDVGLLG